MAKTATRRRGRQERKEDATSGQASKTKDSTETAPDSDIAPDQRSKVIMVRAGVMILAMLIAIGVSLVMPHDALQPRQTQEQSDAMQSVEQRRAEADATSATISPTSPPPYSGPPTIEMLQVLPHDPSAFTQGLLVAKQGKNKFFVESTGLFGKSSARKVDIATGEVVAQYDLPKDFFGEGITAGERDEFVMLTWKSRRGFVLGLDEHKEEDAWTVKRDFEFSTSTGEGWGIDSDGTHLVVSDGSSKIAFWDPKTLTQVREIDVTYGDRPVPYLNELEFAHGFIYANVWYQPVIVKIDPADGKIVSVFDCAEIVQLEEAKENQDAVLNGIAYDKDEDVFYVTGKLWHHVFKVRLLG